MLSHCGSLTACKEEAFSPYSLIAFCYPELALCKSCRTVNRSRKHVICLNMPEQYADQRGLFIKIFMWGEAQLSVCQLVYGEALFSRSGCSLSSLLSCQRTFWRIGYAKSICITENQQRRATAPNGVSTLKAFYLSID